MIKSRAKKKNMEFDLDYKILALTAPDVCPVFKTPLIYFGTNSHSRPEMASIDRINNKRGYVMDNVVIVSFRANALKSDASLGEMIALTEFYKKLSDPVPAI